MKPTKSMRRALKLAREAISLKILETRSEMRGHLYYAVNLPSELSRKEAEFARQVAADLRLLEKNLPVLWRLVPLVRRKT